MFRSRLLLVFITLIISTITAAPLAGLRVGLHSTSSEIAVNGTTNPGWTITNGHKMEPWDIKLKFFISIDYSIQNINFTQDVSVSADPGHTVSYAVSVVGGIGTISSVYPDLYLEATIDFRCYWHNSVNEYTTVNITVFPYDNVLFYFTKPCVIPELNIGTQAGLPNIMDNITVLTNLTLFSPSSEDTTIYPMWLSPSSRVPALSFNLIPVESDISIVSVGISSITPDEFLNFSEPNGLKLHWMCQSPVAAVTQVRIVIDIYFDKLLEFNVTKSCSAQTPDSPSTGWSTAGIFFFSVFLIIVVFCVAGCGYNFVKNEKTGCDVVPGASYYRACYLKIFPEKRYTPQMDTYDTTTTSSSGAKSYGSTGYQNNL